MICLGPVCVPVWGLVPFIVVFLKGAWQYILTFLGLAKKPDVVAKASANAISGEQVAAAEKNSNTSAGTNAGGTLRFRGTGSVEEISSADAWHAKLAQCNAKKIPLIVKFTAKWCKPCKKIDPVFNELAKAHRGIEFAKVDVDTLQKISMKYVVAMPTFTVFVDSEKVDFVRGAKEPELREICKKWS